MASFPVESTEHFCQWLLSDFDHNSKTVMMAPAAGFYAKDELGTTQARLAYVLNTTALKDSIPLKSRGKPFLGLAQLSKIFSYI